MNILCISSNHPPFHSGGYEIRVKNILDGLSARGHEILILTTRQGKNNLSGEQVSNYPVIRQLHDHRRAKFFPKEILFDLLDTGLLEKEIRAFKPDVIYLGHTYILSKALLPYLAEQNIPIIYDEGGCGLIEAWTEHGRWFRFTGDYQSNFALLNKIKPTVIWAVCRIGRGRIIEKWVWPKKMQVIFNSHLNRINTISKGVPINKAIVVHPGVDNKTFLFRERNRLGNPVKLFVPGRIEKRKGQIDALNLLKALSQANIDTRLIFAGAGWVDEYYENLINEIKHSGMKEKITLYPMLSTSDMVRLYQETDICFFPSYFRTGLSRIPLEAMACGCIIISYGNEGSDEVIRNGQNGFLFKEGDLASVVDLVCKLKHNSEMSKQIALNGRRDIESDYSLQSYIDRIEEELNCIFRF